MTTVPLTGTVARNNLNPSVGGHIEEVAAPPEWSAPHEADHVVQFYETDTFLLHRLSEFIGTGLATGDSCIVLATSEHLAELNERLQASGLDLGTARASGQYTELDAAATLARLLVEGSLEPVRFTELLEGLLTRVAERPRIRIFGELVALLWAKQQYDAALQLEALWNSLQQTHSFVLFCAYPLHGFDGAGSAQSLGDVCAAHARVIPAESYTTLADSEDRARAIIRLQQQAQSLQAEIAERQAAEERLRVSELRYRRLFETSTDAILIIDAAAGTITDANPCATDLLGFTNAELLGKQLWELGLFASQATNSNALRSLHTQQMLHYEHLSIPTKDGRQRDVEFVSTLSQANGQTIVQCNLRDITKRVHAEKMLRLREQELTDFFESAAVALHWVGPDGRILWANRAELELLGYSREEYLGHNIAEFHADPQVICDILARLGSGEELHNYEAPLQRKDGSIRHVLISSNVYWQDGKFIHTRCFTRDITERKQAEAEREQLLARERAARVEAQQAVRARDVFLSVAAHELKTPLTTLLGNAQLVQRRAERDGGAAGPAAKSIGVIADQAKRLNKMILALLDVSRIETGQLSIERAPVDLCALARRVVEELQPALDTHVIDTQIPSGPLVIEGDELRLEQVVQNLLTNAVKYSPGGKSIVVQVERHDQEVRLLVTDAGIGIPAQDQPQLFQRFFRASNAEAQFMSGMGIGLYVVKEIVGLHGGTVTVQSSEGAGSTFVVCFPLD